MSLKRPDISELKELARLLNTQNTVAKPQRDSVFIAAMESKQLLDKLDYHGITLLADHFQTLPEQLRPSIPQRKAMVVAGESLRQSALEELFAAFSKLDLRPAVLFKGSALAHTVYPKPWLRPRSDNDIMIESNQRESFHKIFMQLGYRKQFAMDGQYVSYQSTYSKALAGQSSINIDLHWRINNRQILAKAYTATELYNDGSNLNGALTNTRIPSSVDSIIIASLHRLGHHHNEERLSWLYDIHLLANQLKLKQWQNLLTKTANKQLAAITLDALETCELLFATGLPKIHIDALAAQAKTQEPSQIFLQRNLAEWRYFLSDVQALPHFFDKLSFLKETAFPSPEYIRVKMGTRSATYGYVKRLVLGARRFL